MVGMLRKVKLRGIEEGRMAVPTFTGAAYNLCRLRKPDGQSMKEVSIRIG